MQYALSKVDYVIGKFIYMLPSDMNLRIGRVQGYNNKILVSRTGFKIGANLNINLDVKSKEVEMAKTEPAVKPEVKTKPDVKPKKEPDIKSNKDVKPNIKLKHDVKMIRTKPDTNKITYEEEKVALILGTTAVFTVWWMFNGLSSPCLCHEICVYQDSNTCDNCPQVLRQPTNHFLGSVQDP